ncbi:MAG: site-specific integrase [Acidobacteria bacterium]|nr:MAG: site-specific integrase [Acidobacteriota bacterium]
MQDGSVTVERRKRGPDVWCFRWREAGADGRRIHRRIVLGTAEELKNIASARKMVTGLRSEININDIRIRRESITLADLSRRFQQRELADRNPRIAYSTKKAYAGYLEKWIEPRWGEYSLLEIRAVEVESWLKSLNRAPGTRCKIRNVMSLLFNHGRRHDLCDRNPIEWVRQSAKRRTAPDILTTNEVQGLLANLRFRERTLVLLAVTTGLRRSELFALKWKDVDFQGKQICVTRSIVQNVIGVCKTESSQKPVPAHDDLMKALREWRGQTPYKSSESWVFASPANQGRRPYLAQQIMQRHILPIARKLGIAKRIGWHTFRHTYSTLLRSTGAELKIMQELLRHSTIRVTLDTYTQAVTTEKRNAQEAVVALLFREKTQEK